MKSLKKRESRGLSEKQASGRGDSLGGTGLRSPVVVGRGLLIERLCLTMVVFRSNIRSMDRLSLKIDYAFKRFFVTRPDLLIAFLNAVFEEYDHIKIASLEILNPELPGEAIEDKNSILDIRAKDDGGNAINIEMQAHFRDGFAKRSAFYAFRLYMTGIKKGEDHSLLPPVFSINLIDFNLFPGIPFHRCFRLLDVREPAVMMMDGIEFHFLELKKLGKPVRELKDTLDIWIRFIRDSDSLTEKEMDALEKKYPLLKEAHKTLDEISQDSEARLEYDKRQAAIYFHEMALEKKFSEGKAEGKLEDAAKMLAEGMEPAMVTRITGLSEKQLRDAGVL